MLENVTFYEFLFICFFVLGIFFLSYHKKKNWSFFFCFFFVEEAEVMIVLLPERLSIHSSWTSTPPGRSCADEKMPFFKKKNKKTLDNFTFPLLIS